MPDSDLQELYFTGVAKALEISIINFMSVSLVSVRYYTGKIKLFTVEEKYKYREACSAYNTTP